MASQKVDWKLATQDYVTGGKTQAEIARKYGVTPATVSEKAKREDWVGQKLAYNNSLTRRSFEKVAESVATDRSVITSEAVAVARATLRRYAQQLANNEIHVTPKDAELMARFLLVTLDSTGVPEANDSRTVIDANPDAAEFLRRVVEDARGRIDPARVLDAGVLDGAAGTRPN